MPAKASKPAAPSKTVPAQPLVATRRPKAATATATASIAGQASLATRKPTDVRDASAWAGRRFRIAERRFTLGRQYEISNEAGGLLAYASQKWFRVKEAFAFHTDHSKTTISFTVKATKVFDFQANLEVRDASGTLLGTLRRKGWASIVADHWQVVSPTGFIHGDLREDTGRGIARRMLSKLVPYRAGIEDAGGQRVARVEGTFQIWGDTYDLHIDQDGLDPRVLAALVVVVDAMQAERGSLLDVTGLGA